MQMCQQDAEKSAAAAYFVMRGWDLSNPAHMAFAWQYVAGLFREGKTKMASDASDALHLLLGDGESMDVETECAWPMWQAARFMYDPYSSNAEWPVALQHDAGGDLLVDAQSVSSEGSSFAGPALTPLTTPAPHLILRWTPFECASFEVTRPIVEGRLGRFGAVQGTLYEMEATGEVKMSVWYGDTSRMAEAQLCLHGRTVLGEVRLFASLCDDLPEEGTATTVEVAYKRKENKDGTFSDDPRSLGFLFDTFSRCVGNVKHIALTGEGVATIKFFGEESATASLTPAVLPKPYPKWVGAVTRAGDSRLALRRSSSQTLESVSSEGSSVGPPSPVGQVPWNCPTLGLPPLVPHSELQGGGRPHFPTHHTTACL